MSTNSGESVALDDEALAKQLRGLLAPGKKPRRSTQQAAALNARVRDALGLQQAEDESPGAWRLIEMAVENVVIDTNADENPLLAARYLLALGDMPGDLTDSVFDVKSETFRTVGDLIKDIAETPTRLDLSGTAAHRQALALSTSTKHRARTAWAPSGPGTRAAAEALAGRLRELLADESVLAELHQAEAVLRVIDKSVPDNDLRDGGGDDERGEESKGTSCENVNDGSGTPADVDAVRGPSVAADTASAGNQMPHPNGRRRFWILVAVLLLALMGSTYYGLLSTLSHRSDLPGTKDDLNVATDDLKRGADEPLGDAGQASADYEVGQIAGGDIVQASVAGGKFADDNHASLGDTVSVRMVLDNPGPSEIKGASVQAHSMSVDGDGFASFSLEVSGDNMNPASTQDTTGVLLDGPSCSAYVEGSTTVSYGAGSAAKMHLPDGILDGGIEVPTIHIPLEQVMSIRFDLKMGKAGTC